MNLKKLEFKTMRKPQGGWVGLSLEGKGFPHTDADWLPWKKNGPGKALQLQFFLFPIVIFPMSFP